MLPERAGFVRRSTPPSVSPSRKKKPRRKKRSTTGKRRTTATGTKRQQQGRNLLKAIRANGRMSPAAKKKAIAGVRRRYNIRSN